MENSNKWDGVLMSMLSERQNYEKFFEYLFGFLRRKTDFFNDMKKAEEIIKEAGKKNFTQYAAQKEERDKKEAERKQRLAKKEAEKRKKIAEVQKKAQEEAEKRAQAAKVATETAAGDAKKEGGDDDEEKTPPPPGNGAILENYTWTQTLNEVDVKIWLPPDFNRKKLKVVMEADHVLVKYADNEPILDGKWPEEINVDDSLWTLEDDENGIRFLHLALTKWKSKEGWWKKIAEGQPEIDTSKVNPEPSKLGDLDPEMRGTVEKMMFDMRQKQMGKPSSDDLMKQEKLKDFMKAHPEMDFSNVKFS